MQELAGCAACAAQTSTDLTDVAAQARPAAERACRAGLRIDPDAVGRPDAERTLQGLGCRCQHQSLCDISIQTPAFDNTCLSGSIKPSMIFLPPSKLAVAFSTHLSTPLLLPPCFSNVAAIDS